MNLSFGLTGFLLLLGLSTITALESSKAIKKPSHLYGPFYSTGDDFVAFREQGLVIKTENGGVLITGCGHPERSWSSLQLP